MRSERAKGYAVTIVLCLATALPLLGLREKDSFPISTYPMFATPRGEAKLYRLVAVLGEGTVRPIPPELVAGAELLEAKSRITRAARAGAKARRALCERVAAALVTSPDFASASAVELEEARYDALAYFEGIRAPKARKTLTRCAVASERGGP